MIPSIGVVGASCIDIFAVSKLFKPHLHDRTKQIVVDYGSNLWLDNAIHEPGGGGLLAAIVAARQGYVTNLLTKTGSDPFSQIIQKVLKDENVILLGTETPKHHTDTTIHLTSEGSDQTVLHYNASFLSLDKSDCKLIPHSLTWLHLASLPAEKSVLIHIFKLAEKSGIPISLNLQFVHTLPPKLILKVLRRCNIVIINRDEASVLLGSYCTATQAAEKLHEHGVDHVVVYDGLESSTVIADNTFFTTSSYRNTKPLETSGAEEVFAAAYVVDYLENQNVERALTHASAQACSVLTVAGARAGILKRPVLEPMTIEAKII